MSNRYSIILVVLTSCGRLCPAFYPATLLWVLSNTKLNTQQQHIHRISAFQHSDTQVSDVLNWWRLTQLRSCQTMKSHQHWELCRIQRGEPPQHSTAHTSSSSSTTLPLLHHLTCGKGCHHIRHIKVWLRIPEDENRRGGGRRWNRK